MDTRIACVDSFIAVFQSSGHRGVRHSARDGTAESV